VPSDRDPFDLPMPAERYAELVQRRRAAGAPDPLQPVPVREPALRTGDLARALLAESAQRRLESGELLLISEDASLGDLEQAAAAVSPAAPRAVDTAVEPDPLLALLVAPRLLSPRVWAALGWQPPLAEHWRLLVAALRGGAALSPVMLVGHLETWPERIEHLMRIRELQELAAATGARLAIAVRQARLTDLPADERLTRIAAAARPADPASDRRHAVALARLALGPGSVLAD